MAASLSDQDILATNTKFINRVRQSLVATCIAIANEAVTVASLSLHNRRAAYASSVENNPTNFQQIFAYAVATDANVIADATVGGTVALTTANADTQQALVTDAHIAAAISGQFNSFF